MLDQTTAYDQREFRIAVNSAAVLGWCYAATPIVLDGKPELLVFAAPVGLPLAFIACWLIAAPILRRIMKRPISWVRAGLWGGVIAAAIELFGVAISRYRGWRHSLDDSFNYQMGGGDSVRNIDGILTPYGWWVQVQTSAGWILAGIAIALLLRAVIGPGRNVREVQETFS
ncbi:MAG: hypothetical protein AAF409_12035 [Pseudomonadota bacterium]